MRTPSGATLSPVTGPMPTGRLTGIGLPPEAAGITQTPGWPWTRPATHRSPALSQLGVENRVPVSLMRRPPTLAVACSFAAAARSSVYTVDLAAGPPTPAR